MKPSVKSKLTYAAFSLAALVLLYLAFKGVKIEELAKSFTNVNYIWVVLAVIVGTFSHLVRALRWKLLFEPLGYNPSLTNVFGAVVTGYLANLAFPRLGEVTRCGTLQKTDKIPFQKAIGTVFVERALDVLVTLILILIVFFARINFFGKFIYTNAVTPLWEKVLNMELLIPIILLAVTLLTVVLAILIHRNVFGSKFRGKVSNFLRGVIDGVKSVFTMKRRKAFFAYTVLLWFLYWLMTWLMVFSIEATSSLSPLDGLFIMVAGSLGMVAPVQGGFGAFHIITASALSIYGISWADGLTYAIISHESQTLLFIVLGVGALVYFMLRKRKKTAQ
ncbi:MAG: lysylphosphatidylglycerol synthase transmembrane domain-containing protein [Bacteroidales bacterium]|nr:lysylphosphatidylglycerol synthase transmembrane domain-containing protein [Bacteroidales bacterium]MDD4672398.1 lysylphosphatidylglycerol synthase transmembrane domain-containing protein [Bacteroidales bacterium]MDY0347471.1 lysylphosphatidylglycerol synthase transmembrane domain-containing protein [Tenuifilaceae bacterium]